MFDTCLNYQVKTLTLFYVCLLLTPKLIDSASFAAKYSKNILEFCENNALASDHTTFISFDENDKIVNRLLHHLLSSTQTSHQIAYKNTYLPSSKQHISSNSSMQLSETVVAIGTTSNSSNWQQYLDIIAGSKIRSSIFILVGEATPTHITLINTFFNDLSRDSLFYFAYHTNQPPDYRIKWNQVTTLRGYSQSVVNNLQFDSLGKIREKYDMQGLHLVSLTLSWAPYFTLYGCNKFGTGCNSKGYLTDVMDILGKMMNFTWESHKEPNDNWGTNVVSGPPNSSGVWDGVMGEVFNGKYQFSLRYEKRLFITSTGLFVYSVKLRLHVTVGN